MGNYHDPITTATLFRPEDLNPIFSGLDRALSYTKNCIVHCDGAIAYSAATGQLTWNGTLRILFVRADGQLTENTVATGGVTLADGQMAYADLSETNGASVSAAVATLATGIASTTLAYNRVVLGYRNTASDKFYPVALRLAFDAVGDMAKSVYDPDGDGVVDVAKTANAVAWVNVNEKPAPVVSIGGMTLAGNGGKVVTVNEAGDELILATPTSGGATTLDGLSDVDLTVSPTDGQSLVYDSASGQWKAATASGSGSLDFAQVAMIAMMMGG